MCAWREGVDWKGEARHAHLPPTAAAAAPHLLHADAERLALRPVLQVPGPGKGELRNQIIPQEVALRELEHQAHLRKALAVVWGCVCGCWAQAWGDAQASSHNQPGTAAQQPLFAEQC